MQVAQTIPPGERVGTADQRVVMHGVPWSHFEAILALRGDASGPRISYLRGELEFMSPSRSHESVKSLLARMIELHALETGVRLSAYGSWTLRNSRAERAAEPDECYIVGDTRQKEAPDLVVEVIWTSGGLDKLELYRGLGVSEVWLWRDEVIRIFRLEGDRYAEAPKSHVLPDIDTALIAKLAGYEDQHAAVVAFRTALRRV